MSIDKLVSFSFGKAANTYDNAAIYHQEIARHLTQMIYDSLGSGNISEPKNVLDVGAGTGVLSEEFLKVFKSTSMTLNDISNEMLMVAKRKFQRNDSHFTFLNDNAEKIDLTKYDMLISSMSFQWFSDVNLFIEKTLRYCKNIAFSIPISGTFHGWYELLDSLQLEVPIIKYKSMDEMLSLCNSLDLSYKKIDEKEYVMNFCSAKDFMKYLKSIGANVSGCKNDLDSLKSLMNIKDPLRVSYKVFFAVLQGAVSKTVY